MTEVNLAICQDCKIEPAIYGDGLTWSRCSGCQLKYGQSEIKVVEPTQPEPPSGESFEHKIIPGLTSIILPVYMINYSLFHYTGNCIGSIREHTNEKEYELVIIDNGSPIKPPSEASYYAQKVIVNETNLGVTKAWNQGIRMSVGEYIVLINNDVQVFEHWLEDMKNAIDDGYDLIMAHPMYSKTEPFARAVESKKIRTRKLLNGSYRRISDIVSDFRDFSCVMFKRDLVNEIGLFDERFFNYCSDSDFFDRMKEAGKKWGCLESVATSHLSDATGYAMPDTRKIMDKDKETYAALQIEKSQRMPENQQEEASTSSEWTPPAAQPRKEGELIRTPLTGDAIYLKGKDDKWHHITSPQVLHALGFEFGQEKIVESMDQIGEDITMSNYQQYE